MLDGDPADALQQIGFVRRAHQFLVAVAGHSQSPVGLAQSLLRLLALGDVPDDAHDGRAGRQLNRTKGHFYGKDAAVLAYLVALKCEALTCKDSTPKPLVSRLDRLMIDIPDGHGKQFIPGVAQARAGLPVYIPDPASLIAHEDSVGCLVHHRAIPLLALFQPLVSLLALGDHHGHEQRGNRCDGQDQLQNNHVVQDAGIKGETRDVARRDKRDGNRGLDDQRRSYAAHPETQRRPQQERQGHVGQKQREQLVFGQVAEKGEAQHRHRNEQRCPFDRPLPAPDLRTDVDPGGPSHNQRSHQQIADAIGSGRPSPGIPE